VNYARIPDIPLPEGIHFFERGWLSSNNILLLDDTHCVLVDSGYHTHAAQTFALVNGILQGRPLTAIVNTHLHSDHCGGNAFLQARYPEVQTWIPPGHIAYVQHWDPIRLGYQGTGQHCPMFTANAALTVGQSIEIAGNSWLMYAAAGHDPHSFILFSKETGICITADALWENGFGVVFPEIEGEEGFEDVGLTLDLIESLQPTLIFPGHGAPFTDISGALIRARDRLARFTRAPTKHSLYAAKVLVKFKLLEFQQISVEDFHKWASTATHLHTIHQIYFGDRAFAPWFAFICDDLVRSGAARVESGHFLNA